MFCVLCCYHPDNKQKEATFIVAGISMCELHTEWAIEKKGATVPQYSGMLHHMLEELGSRPITYRSLIEEQ